MLPFERCMELLAAVPVGRVSFFADGEIVVLPVNHVMDGPDPVFRTARGSKLSAAEGLNVVAFEADGYDERTRTATLVREDFKPDAKSDVHYVFRLVNAAEEAKLLRREKEAADAAPAKQKLAEAHAKADLLIAQHRRARAVGKASDAKINIGDSSKAAAFDRMKHKVVHEQAVSQAKAEIAVDDVEDRLAALEKEDRIEQLLSELKTKRGA